VLDDVIARWDVKTEDEDDEDDEDECPGRGVVRRRFRVSKVVVVVVARIV